MEWWQRAVVYQVYPRSFQDSDGDGVGDLRGIESRLDHLVWLGVDTVWLSPINKSPMVDFGYDVSDYCGVHPEFGTLDDFDRLMAAVKSRGMRLLLDLVPNHTSDQHPWFVESRSSRTNPKRDWYLWRDSKPDGSPPNNWQSVFGGGAWETDPRTGQAYYHAYLKEQPDLNWANPEVRAAMRDAMRFWLDRGVSGFRVDVIGHLSKDTQFRDNPPDPNAKPDASAYGKILPIHTYDREESAEIVAYLRSVLDEYDERVMIGEVYVPIPRLVRYYGWGCHLPFNFRLLQLPWKADVIRHEIAMYESLLPPGAWPNWVLGNHDAKRIATRVGAAQAAVAATLLLTLRGTPTIYQGDELGIEQVAIPPDRVRDPVEHTLPGRGRDGCRTPMPWVPTKPSAGFSTGEPWLPLNADWPARNVETMACDENSILNLHRRLLALRASEPALQGGSLKLLPGSPNVVAFLREQDGRRLACAHSLTHEGARFVPGAMKGRIVFATDRAREGELVTKGEVELRGNDAVVVALE